MSKKIIVLSLLLSGCAQLHHAQIGDIYSPPGYVKKPFDIKISESGVNLEEIGAISRAVIGGTRGRDAQALAGAIGLFQMGPRTGNPVYVNNYAQKVMQLIYEKCPSGDVSGLTSIRETRKYPVVSGEIVRVTGYCLIRKEAYTGEKEG
jgi:hypothetical protein